MSRHGRRQTARERKRAAQRLAQGLRKRGWIIWQIDETLRWMNAPFRLRNRRRRKELARAAQRARRSTREPVWFEGGGSKDPE